MEILKRSIQSRRADALRKRAECEWKATQKWLQCDYPVQLAVGLMDETRTPAAKGNFSNMIAAAAKTRCFKRPLLVPDLWAVEYHFLIRYCQMPPPGGGHPRTVRCSAAFEALLATVAPAGTCNDRDAVRSLGTLLDLCAPGSALKAFVGSYTIARLLHLNDYVLDKAFVYGVVCLSKWLSSEHFPQGIYDKWPPAPPPAILPIPPALLIEDEATISDEIDLSPRSRPGLPAASSTDRA